MPVEGVPFYPLPPGTATSEWVKYDEAQAEIGVQNLTKLADLSGTKNQTEILATIQKAMNMATEQVNMRFQAAGYAIPLTPTEGNNNKIPWTTIRLAAAKIMHWQLYNQRGKRDNDKEGDHLTEKYQWAMQQLDWIIAQSFPLTLEAGVDSPQDQVGRIKTIKINRARVAKIQSDEYARRYTQL